MWSAISPMMILFFAMHVPHCVIYKTTPAGVVIPHCLNRGGMKMAKFWGNCGAPIDSGDKFCGSCGAELEEEKPIVNAIKEKAVRSSKPEKNPVKRVCSLYCADSCRYIYYT